MRLIFVTPAFVTEKRFDGGISNYLYRVSLYLQSFGHNVILVVASHSDEIIYHEGIEVHRVNTQRPLWFRIIDKITRFQKYFYSLTHIWLSYILNKEVKKIIQQKPVDIIQYPNIAGLALFRPSNIPVVIRLSSYKKLQDEVNFGTGNTKPKLPLYKQFHYFQTLAMGKADRIFAPSQIIAEAVKNDLGYNVEIIETPFLNTEIEENQSTINDLIKQTKNSDYLLFFGTKSIIKGVKYLADNLYEILEKNNNIYFIFIGRTLGEFNRHPIDKYILNQAKEHSKRVIIISELRHNKLIPIIKNAKAIVLPSLIDNLPNTCIESMALKKPVIAAINSSLDQLIEDNVSGYLFNNKIPGDLVNTITKVCAENKVRLDEIGEMAFKRILKLHPDITVKKLIKFYLNTIAEVDNKKDE